MKGFCTVEGALEKFYDRSDSDSDDNGNDLAHVGSQHMHHISDDYDVAMGASQSTDHMPPANHMDISQGRRPGQKHPARAPPAPSTLTHPSSLKVASASHAQQLSQTQQMSQDQLSLGRQPSRNLGSGLGRAGSAGGVGPSRLGATGQGRASGSSQQASQGVGHIEAAQLESSGTSWKLPFLGSGDRLEEKDIRLPPISPRACFGDEYEVHYPSLLAVACCWLTPCQMCLMDYSVLECVLVPALFCVSICWFMLPFVLPCGQCFVKWPEAPTMTAACIEKFMDCMDQQSTAGFDTGCNSPG